MPAVRVGVNVPGEGEDRLAAAGASLAPAVLLVSALFPPSVGGSAVLFGEIYSRLPRLKVRVLTDEWRSAGPPPTPPPGLEIIRRRLATNHWGVMHPEGAWFHCRIGAAIRAIARREQTVVHCGRNLPEGFAAFVSRLAGGPQYICWGHGEDITGALTSREFAALTRRAFRGASAVIANSRNTRRLLLGMGVPEERIAVVYPGVDPDRYRPGMDGGGIRAALLDAGGAEAVPHRAQSAAAAGPLLLSVGRLTPHKGQDLVIRAVAALRDHLPGLRYAIVGGGADRARLEALAGECGVTDRVVFAGEVPAADLPRYYAACDVFAMPNRAVRDEIEGFGIVFLEASACAKPVVGGTTGGAPEAVEDGVTGLLVSGTDVAELAAAIKRLAGSPALRHELGAAGRARVVRGFTWERSAAEVAALHGRVARARPGHPRGAAERTRGGCADRTGTRWRAGSAGFGGRT